jgi:hypothetical protein
MPNRNTRGFGNGFPTSPASHNVTSQARPQMLFGVEKHAGPLSVLEANDE